MIDSSVTGALGTGSRRGFVKVCLCLALVLTLVATRTAFAAPKDGQKFGDWAVKCQPVKAGKDGKKPDAKTFCFIFQRAVLNKEGQKQQQVMSIVVGYGAKDDHSVIKITGPLGVYLPAGFLFQVDQGQPLRINFETCLRTGCEGRFEVDEKYLAVLKKGLKGKVVFENRTRKKIALPVSLVGFTAGLNSLR